MLDKILFLSTVRFVWENYVLLMAVVKELQYKVRSLLLPQRSKRTLPSLTEPLV